MALRISKSIMGVRFSGNLSSRERRPTQAELAAEDKEQFLSKVAEVCENCCFEFILLCGYSKQAVIYGLKNGVDARHFLPDAENYTIFQEVSKLSDELETILNKVNFSNVLTAKRRELITDFVFEIYSASNKAKNIYSDEHILKIIAEQKNKPYEVVLKEKEKTRTSVERKLSIGKKIFYAFAFLFSGLLSLASIASYNEVASGKTNNSATGVVFVVLMSTPLILTILSYRKQKGS